MRSHVLREAALSYVQRGWHVFPCHYKGKTPATSRGFKDASLDCVDQYWPVPLPGPDVSAPYNIGIACGAVSGLVVVDIDPKHNGNEGWRKLCEDLGIPLPCETLSVTTGSLGTHYYFKHPGGFVPCRVGLREGVDIRADGGYVIAPPSVHENGRDYRGGSGDVLDLPTPLLEVILAAAAKPVLAPSDSAEGLVMEGGRNDYLMRVAGQLRRPGLTEAALSAALLQQNEDVCNPPLPEHEVLRIAQNISRYQPSAPIEANVLTQEEKPWVTAADLMGQMFEYLDDKRQVHGMATGIASFDKLMGGGKRLGELTAWHAEAKTGKNSLWHKFMHLWLNQNKAIGYASREITPERDVLPNLLSLETLTNVWEAKVTDEARQKYMEAIKRWPLYFTKGFGAMSFQEIDYWVRSLHSRGVEYFWFDHLHFMLEDPEDHKTAAKLIKDMKVLAQSLKVHMDIIIQPNRLEEGRKLSMHSLKGGAVINQTVDNLIILERHETAENVIEVKMELGRSKLVKRGKLYLAYNDVTTDYTEVEPEKKVSMPPKQGFNAHGGRPAWVGGPSNQRAPQRIDYNAKRLDE